MNEIKEYLKTKIVLAAILGNWDEDKTKAAYAKAVEYLETLDAHRLSGPKPPTESMPVIEEVAKQINKSVNDTAALIWAKYGRWPRRLESVPRIIADLGIKEE